MKQSLTLLGVVLVGVVVFAQQPGPNPEMAAALAKQVEIEKVAPRLQITEEVLPLVVPGHTIGEAVGVAKNSKGHLFVFTRSGATGPAKGATASQLFEFDPALKFVKQWGPDNYAASFAHTVRVDKDDNVWMVDEGSNMVVKFNPQGKVALVLGRKPEAIDYLERFTEEGHKETGTPRRGTASSTAPPTSPGTPRATSSSPTATTTHASPRCPRTAPGLARSVSAARGPTSSTRCMPSPTDAKGTSTSPIAATAASRCTIR